RHHDGSGRLRERRPVPPMRPLRRSQRGRADPRPALRELQQPVLTSNPTRVLDGLGGPSQGISGALPGPDGALGHYWEPAVEERMTNAQPNGNRRLDRITAPGFAEDLQDLSLTDLRAKRDECLAEREYLSLLRRLVQGRLDIVRAEVERRRTGGDPSTL